MRIVEFVGVIVALIGLFAWLLGRPHTLQSIDRTGARRITTDDAPSVDTPWLFTSPGADDTVACSEAATADDACNGDSGSDGGSETVVPHPATRSAAAPTANIEVHVLGSGTE